MKLLTESKGIIAQLKVEMTAAYKNLNVSIPTNAHCCYDALIDYGDKILRAQIKYCNRRHNGRKYLLELRLDNLVSKRPFYNKDDIDIILVYCPIPDTVLVYEAEKFHRCSSIRINLKDPNSKNYYKKYIW
jgi:hypothetical protein